MNIAFCVNQLGLMGLGATVTSLIRNCSDHAKLNFYFICAYLSDSDKAELKKLLEIEGFSGRYSFINFDPKSLFGSFRSLHGDWTAYGILLLSDLIDENEVLYLDSDLVIETDILELTNFDFNGKALAAVPGGTLNTEYEHNFYINKVGLSPNLASFNSGVVLFNLNEWKKNKLKEKCFEIARRFPNDLLSADQTILNALFAGDFSNLPFSYNCGWLPNDDRPTVANKMIIHFFGSPKPWDVFGSMIHKGFNTWKSYSNKRWEQNYRGFSLQSLKRAWNLRRSYARVILNKIKEQ